MVAEENHAVALRLGLPQIPLSLRELDRTLPSASPAAQHALASPLKALERCLDEVREAISRGCSRRQLSALKQSLVVAYEELAAAARTWLPEIGQRMRAIRVPRPGRTIFHVGMGLSGVLLYSLVLDRSASLWAAGFLLTCVVILEIVRRVWPSTNDRLVFGVFGAISRPRERYQINSGTYYLSAIVLITALASKEAVCAALLVLAFGDPAASLIGSAWGRTKLYGGKSLEGLLAFVVVAFTAVLIYVLLAMPQLPMGRALAASFFLATLGALTELFAGRIDDNLAIPVVCTIAATLVF